MSVSRPAGQPQLSTRVNVAGVNLFQRRYQYMLRCFLLLVVLTTVTPTLSAAMPGAVTKAAQCQASVVWKSEITKDKYGNPHGKLFLLVGGRKKLILPKVTAEC